MGCVTAVTVIVAAVTFASATIPAATVFVGPLPSRRRSLLGLRLLVLVLCAVNLTFEIVGSSLILAPPLAKDVACALSRTKCRAAARRVPWAPGRLGWSAAQSEGLVASGVRAGAWMRAREVACARGCARARMCARVDVACALSRSNTATLHMLYTHVYTHEDCVYTL